MKIEKLFERSEFFSIRKNTGISSRSSTKAGFSNGELNIATLVEVDVFAWCFQIRRVAQDDTQSNDDTQRENINYNERSDVDVHPLLMIPALFFGRKAEVLFGALKTKSCLSKASSFCLA